MFCLSVRFSVCTSIVALVATLANTAVYAQPVDPVARDVARAAGLNFRVFTHTQGETPIFDFDSDGKKDILLSSHHKGDWPMMRNVGGKFMPFLTLPWNDRHGCAAADLGSPSGDGRPDGLPDLFCVTGACGGNCTREYPNSLFLQTPARTFVDKAREWGVADVHGRGRIPVILDFDRDGLKDLVALNAGPSAKFPPAVSRLYRNTGGGFVEITATPVNTEIRAECGKAADLDGDGWIDLIVCSRMSETSATMTLKNVNGTFVDISSSTAYVGIQSRELDVVDVNGDRKNDLLILEFTRLSVWLNEGGLHPRMNYSFPINQGRDIAAGDVNLDGRPDIYIAQGSNARFRDFMLINDGDGTSFHTLEIPQIFEGESDIVTAFTNWKGTRRTAFLVSNSKWELGPGPYQLIEFNAP
jgi:hypothetical protein